MAATDPYAFLPVSPFSPPPNFNFASHIIDNYAAFSPDSVALHWASQDLATERCLTYSYFSQQSQRIATWLQSLGLRAGDTLIIILPRLPEWWELAIACLRSGIILCPCTTLLVDKDIEYRLNVSHASAFVGDENAIKKCLKVRRNCPRLKTVIQIGGTPPSGVDEWYSALQSIKSTQFDVPQSLTAASPALTFFTSGTTGPPKIVLHNQISYPLCHALTGIHWLDLKLGKTYWNLSEQGWAKAAWSFFSTFNCGATLFVHDDRLAFDAERTIEVLHRFPITTLCAPPTVYRQLVRNENRKILESSGGRPMALVHATGAGEPLNADVIRIWKEMTGMEIRDGYGQTEMILVCANQVGEKVKYGSMGRPIPGVPLVVINNEGDETNNDEEGDIAVEIKGEGLGEFKGLFEGYIDKETGKVDRKIKQFASGRHFYLTGDRATRDNEGYFWFVGRSDDVINSSGYRIGPFEVESTLKLHPNVVESAVVASPDPQRDEVVKAFVVLTNEAAARLSEKGQQDKLVKDLQDFCKENAAPYKYPRKVEFVDATFLPKTISGKIKRSELKKLERDKFRKEQGSKL